MGWHDDDFGAGTGYTIDLKEDGRYKQDILSSWSPSKQVRVKINIIIITSNTVKRFLKKLCVCIIMLWSVQAHASLTDFPVRLLMQHDTFHVYTTINY